MANLRQGRAVAYVQNLFREPPPELIEAMAKLAISLHEQGLEKGTAMAATSVLSLFMASYLALQEAVPEERTLRPQKG